MSFTAQAAADRIAAQMAALTGCTSKIARIAAGSMLAFATDPDHGLGDLSDRLNAAAARKVIAAWKSAQAHRRAA